jgi:hypothetical protein
MILYNGKMWIHAKTEKIEENWRENISFSTSSLIQNATQMDERANFSYAEENTKLLNIIIEKFTFKMCLAKLYGHSTDTALFIDTLTNINF